MLRGFWRVASLAILLGLGLSLVGCSQFGKLKAKKAFKDANVAVRAAGVQEGRRAVRGGDRDRPRTCTVAYFYLANSYDNLFKPSPQGRDGERRAT